MTKVCPMTIDEVLDRLAHDHRSWTVHPSGHIRLYSFNVCPLTSLYREEGLPPYSAYEWEYVAARLGVALADAHALVEVADCSLPALIATGARHWQLELRRSLLAACGLPPEGDHDDDA